MPQIPEIVIAMLACAKIVVAHSVVYGGFSVEAVAERSANAHSSILITADEAMRRSPTIDVCITVKRTGEECYMENDRDFWWQMIEKYGVTILYTSPTAIRGFMRYGSSCADKHNLSTLGLLGSATKPFFGNEISVVDEKGRTVENGTEGNLVIKNPWPGMARTILGDPDRFIEKYWKLYKKQGWYLTGDSAKMDEDGHIWIIGRNDDVLKVSGYQLGSAEIESALVSHPAVFEAAAIGLPDSLKGNIIHATVILAQGITASDTLSIELKNHVAFQTSLFEQLGIACIS